MPLFTILITLAFRKLWGTANPIQQDEWFERWLTFLEARTPLARMPLVRLIVALAGPVLLLSVILAVLANISSWLLLPAGVLVLLYSLGRNPASEKLDTYISAHACDDYALASAQVEKLADMDIPEEQDWTRLHQTIMKAAAYRSFEGVFAVFFWFLLLGPAGALLYRLTALYQARGNEPLAARWLWLLEWPAARVLGASFAITGNFDGCMKQWRRCVGSEEHSAADVLYETAMGAVSREDDGWPGMFGRRELIGLKNLYQRTYWLWLGLVGVWAILY